MVYRMGKAPIIVIMITAIVTFLSSSTFADVYFASESNVNYSTGPYPKSVATGDFNNDGTLDIATVDSKSSSLFLGNDDGTFQAKRDIIPSEDNSRLMGITIGDFNNDGKLDMATRNFPRSGGVTMSVVLGNGDGTFQTPKIYWTVGFNPRDITSGDFNGDGNLDIAANYFDSVSVLLGNGDGTFQTTRVYGTGSYQVNKVKTADINGDGKLDILTANLDTYSGKPSTVSVLLGNGDGTFLVGTVLEVGGWTRDIVSGDFNGDGSVDIATIKDDYDAKINLVSVFIGNGDGTYQTRKDYAGGAPGDSGGGAIVAADINGDGKLDLATASARSVSIYIGNGDGTFQPRNMTLWESGPYTGVFSLAAGDFNKDGKIDLAAVGDRNHAISIFINTTQNRSPVADAGYVQVIECAGPSGASVALDGSGSHDPDGDALTYIWAWAGGATGGVRPTVELPLGTTLITLTVNDGKTSSTAKVNITIQDTISPVTIATGGNGDWYSSSVLTSFSSSDRCTGVKDIHFSVDGVETVVPEGPAAALITTEGIHSILYYSVDNRGNAEPPNSMVIKIDKTPPSTSSQIGATSGNNDWYRSDVQVTLAATDNVGGSGVVKAEYSFNGTDWINYLSPFLINTEGTLSYYYRSTDNAGNVETGKSVTVKIDKTPPLIAATITPSPINGWNNTGVTVTFQCSDALSGIDQCPAPVTVNTEGAGQVITGTAIDKAGNTSNLNVTLNIDKTAPVITGAPLTHPNANSWYNGNVTVHFIATDALSGLASITPDVVLTSEGSGQTATGTAVDVAGNSSSYTVTGINIDKTAPAITIIGVANGATYNLGLVPQASYTATDALSGVAASNGSLTGGDVEGFGQYTYTVTAIDKAGNTTTSSVTYTVNATPDGIIDLILTLPLDPQTVSQLINTLSTALVFYSQGKSIPGDNKMEAFINQVYAPGQNIPGDIVTLLTKLANYIIAHN